MNNIAVWIHYGDVIMSVMASQIPGVSIVCQVVCSGAHPRKIKGLRHRIDAENVSILCRHHDLERFRYASHKLGINSVQKAISNPFVRKNSYEKCMHIAEFIFPFPMQNLELNIIDEKENLMNTKQINGFISILCIQCVSDIQVSIWLVIVVMPCVSLNFGGPFY